MTINTVEIVVGVPLIVVVAPVATERPGVVTRVRVVVEPPVMVVITAASVETTGTNVPPPTSVRSVTADEVVVTTVTPSTTEIAVSVNGAPGVLIANTVASEVPLDTMKVLVSATKPSSGTVIVDMEPPT